ncbi:LEAF RUST 10 DISEASE-RESISTANCE LOCUS RECEPTOR-LIKE PROTEIN KINASE-like 2.1 [Dioscorea cayenensis subsp. rotundata]|uniref:LEAF RUST 10 DISEASE-RESISTANCE LOCUS RECEPTOR-LIKE PROTEIN KINASE-like 2.1 n=1 Tax=Dioscorea cayennensis subsp. rotundata TaxID=55577 RepID=A0AB40B990_DIOCR|nr:LEAF RUST 10 DISEASE-RESISTANCE LOCUS RECEPTOR-LIKE PROTEIN KINASE-like 2.1 [Dioscorea cayenensis subsp. rotundata]
MQMTQTSFFYWSSHFLFLLFLSHSFRPSSTHPPVPTTKPGEYLSADYYNYYCANSLPLQCSNIMTDDIKYPFRTSNQPSFCGHPDPGFELTCAKGMLSIQIGNKKYHVLKDISYGNRVLQLLDFDLLFAGPSCPQKMSNTSFDFSLFTYPDDNQDTNLTMFLNCHDPLHDIPDPIMDFLFPTQCYNNEFFGQYSYFTLQSFGQKLPMHDLLANCCDTTVLLPVSNLNFSPETFRNGIMNYFSKALKFGFNLTWTVDQGWCEDECLKTGGICGSDPNGTKANACFCPAGIFSNGTSCAGKNSMLKNKRVIIGVGAVAAGILALGCLWLLYFPRRKRQQQSSCTLLEVCCWHGRTSEDQTIETFLQKHGTVSPKRYSYLEVKKMTNSFHHKLGEGGFGSVFKGNFTDGHTVAVKLLNNTRGDGEEFLNEVASIGRTSHINIVTLLGFCFQGSKRALIYDFMPNGSLDKYIYAEDPKTMLCWDKLFQIAVGIARGLEYLHRGCNTRIVHFDIKPHNILLDEDFCPKISDFGLAKFGTHKESIILSMADTRGTMGFIAPEVFSRSFGVVSSKSDVYSYGMMVLEMVGGRKNLKASADRTSEIYFPHWIYEHKDQDGDLQQYGVTTETEEIAKKMILIGLWCIQTRPEDRPSMNKVVEMLQGSIDELQIPPKPYLSSPSRSLQCSSLTMALS